MGCTFNSALFAPASSSLFRKSENAPEIMNGFAAPTILAPQTDALPPDGFQWALMPRQQTAVEQRHGYITKFGDKRNDKIEQFEYEKLSNMRTTIRLLKLMAGNQDTPDVECQLFEAEIKGEKVLKLKSKNPELVDNSVDLKNSEEDSEKTESTELVEYEALSWSWGSDPPEYQILIRKGETRTRMRATGALVWAFKHLRYPDRDRTLWVDAICINQGSVDEKNHQVQMMSQIYSYATRVCIWLGLDDVESSRAIRFIKEEILQLQHFDTLCEDGANSQKWQSLLLLMQRPWFFRRWVVQEIALARDATIYCGPDEITWKDFSVAVELFVEVETATHRLSEVMKKDPKFYHVPGWFEYVSALGASLLVEATGMVFRYYKQEAPEGEQDNQATQNGSSRKNKPIIDDESSSTEESEEDTPKRPGSQIGKDNINRSNGQTKIIKPDSEDNPISQRRPLLSLEYLVSKLTIFQATEPRDAIYALLSIARDTTPSAWVDGGKAFQIHEALAQSTAQKPFIVDYGRPYTDVCQDFIEFCIARSDPTRALDILCRPWAPDPHTSNSPGFQRRQTRTHMEKRLRKLEGWKDLKKCQRTGAQYRDLKLPSWIPTLAGAPFAMYSQAGIHIMKMGRVNADPLVGLPDGPRSYDAAQGAKIDLEVLKFKKRRLHKAHCMYVKGFILDIVQKTADSSQGGNIPVEWLKLSEWEVFSKEFEKDTKTRKDIDPPEVFWRTMVADRGKEGRNPPYYYARACKESVLKGGLASGSVNTSDLINNERNSIVAQFCRRVQAVIWNRSLIRTAHGNLGVANKNVAKGDLVAILYGCSVPVILRPNHKLEEQIKQEGLEEGFVKEAEVIWQFISQCRKILKRKKKWNSLPEKKDPPTHKWGKEDIRIWRKKYLELLKENEPTTKKPPRRSNAKINKIKEDYYYEFLGECYIHGMMDGEAVARKARHQSDPHQSDPHQSDPHERFCDTIFELR